MSSSQKGQQKQSSANTHLLQQISLLSGAIRQHKQNAILSYQSSVGSIVSRGRGGGRSSTNSRGNYHHIARNPLLPTSSRPLSSRNRTLVNAILPPSTAKEASSSSSFSDAVDSSAQIGESMYTKHEPVIVSFVRKGNKLVRVKSKETVGLVPASSDLEVHSKLYHKPKLSYSSSVVTRGNPSPSKRSKIVSSSSVVAGQYHAHKSLVVKNGISYTKKGSALVAVGAQPLPKTTPSVAPLKRRSSRLSSKSPQVPPIHRLPAIIAIEGVSFRVGRRKLVRLSQPSTSTAGLSVASNPKVAPRAHIPKVLVLNGASYHRTKKGNLVLAKSTVHSSAKSSKSKRSLNKTLTKPKKPLHCQFYRFGKCTKTPGPSHPYSHDPAYLAPCPVYIKAFHARQHARRTVHPCPDPCPLHLSHSPTLFNMPLCTHFARLACTNDPCLYLHVKHADSTEVCERFAREGACPLGVGCPCRHEFKCPDWAKGGEAGCRRLRCFLPHSNAPSGHKGGGEGVEQQEVVLAVELPASEEEANLRVDLDVITSGREETADFDGQDVGQSSAGDELRASEEEEEEEEIEEEEEEYDEDEEEEEEDGSQASDEFNRDVLYLDFSDDDMYFDGAQEDNQE